MQLNPYLGELLLVARFQDGIWQDITVCLSAFNFLLYSNSESSKDAEKMS
jgi:hypothetical protein